MSDAAARPASGTGAGQERTAPRKPRKPGQFECKLGVLLGLAGLVASRLGQLWIAFDVFAQFTLQFAVVTVAFLAGFLVPRGKLLTAFILFVAGIAAIGIWPQLASQAPRTLDMAKAGERELKVASFNSWYESRTPGLVRAEIERLDADVITLVEISPSGRDEMFTALRARYPYQATCFETAYCNLAILSKLPIAATEARIAWDGPPLIMAKLGPEAGNLTVFGVHTIRFPHSRAQYQQVGALVAWLTTIPGRKLVMGDFNATPFSRIPQLIARNAGLKRLTDLPSWPARLTWSPDWPPLAHVPQMAIDHIFASPELRQLETEQLGEPAGSDHFPVSLRLAVPLQ